VIRARRCAVCSYDLSNAQSKCEECGSPLVVQTVSQSRGMVNSLTVLLVTALHLVSFLGVVVVMQSSWGTVFSLWSGGDPHLIMKVGASFYFCSSMIFVGSILVVFLYFSSIRLRFVQVGTVFVIAMYLLGYLWLAFLSRTELLMHATTAFPSYIAACLLVLRMIERMNSNAMREEFVAGITSQ
jgi:hypothetical protein